METGYYVRHAIRSLRVRPVLAATCIAVTALGVGAATAVSSAAAALLFRPLPLPHADRLVTGYALREGFDPFGTSLLEFDAFRSRSNAFERTGLARQQTSTIRGDAGTERIRTAAVTADYLTTVGVAPIVGRTITAADDRSGAAAVVLISHALWQRHFASEPNAVGSTFSLNGRPTVLIGIMPQGFDLPFAADAWVPLQVQSDTLPLDQRLAGMYTFIARLRADVPLERANQEVVAIARSLADEYPARRGWTYRAIGLRQQLLGDLDGRTTRAIAVLMVGVGFLLAICCVNVANLLLLHAFDRHRDLAVRLAMGASHRHLAVERFFEYALLGLLGGTLGTLIATWVAPLLARLNPIRATSFSPQLTDFRIDGTVLLIAMAGSTILVALFGLVSAAGLVHRINLASSLSAGGRHSGLNRHHGHRLRVLVVVQVAVALVMLVGGALLVRSFDALRRAELGFRADGLFAAQLTLPAHRTVAHRERTAAMETLVQAVRSLPGVTAAGVSTNIPLQRMSFDSLYTVEGRAQVSANDVPITAHRVVSPHYLQAIGVRLVRGRLLSDSDTAEATRVVVITEQFARQAWPDQDPIGRRIRRGRATDTRPWLTVVGVIADVKEDRFNYRIDRAAWYLPYAQEDNSASPTLVVRADGDVSGIARAVRAAVTRIDPDIGASELFSVESHVAEVLTTERFAAILLTALSASGLLLAVLGLYGAMSYFVAGKTPEIALRIAVGASRLHVAGSVLREVASLTLPGLVVGTIVSIAAGPLLEQILYRVAPYDAMTYAAVVAGIIAVSALAAALPVARAVGVDPARLLR